MIYYKAGYKYQLTKDYEHPVPIRPEYIVGNDYITLTNTGRLIIKKGYAWDGPSGPTIDTKTFMRGSLVHDALYQLLRENILHPSYREIADYELRRICLEDGMNRMRAWWVYHGVQAGAAFAADPMNRKPILTAP